MSTTWDRAWRRRAEREHQQKKVPKDRAAKYARCEAEGRAAIEAKSGLAAAKAVATYMTHCADGTIIFEARLFGTQFYRAIH